MSPVTWQQDPKGADKPSWQQDPKGADPHGKVTISPAPGLGAHVNWRGLVCRFAPIKGETPANVLSHKIWLPAILNDVTLTDTGSHSEYDTLSAGQFSQPAMGPPSARQLRDLPLDSLLMAWDPQWFVVTGQDVNRLRSSLAGIVQARCPVHLLMTFHPHAGPLPEADMDVTMRSFTRTLRAGEPDTHYVSLSLKEWRDPTVKRRGERPAGKQPTRADLPTTHRLTSTDTLHSLSQRYYGTYDRWRLIRDANGISKRFGAKTAIVKLGGRFRVGAKIKIPALPWSQTPKGADRHG